MFEVNKQEFVDVTSTFLMPLKEDIKGELLFIFCYDTDNKINKTYMIPINKVGLRMYARGIYRDVNNDKSFDMFGWTCTFTRRKLDGKVYLDIQIGDLDHFFNSHSSSKVVCFTDKELIEPSNNLLNFTLQI